MILSIAAYGTKVLRRKAENIEKGHEGLEKLIEDMYETMYLANGVGLAGPQVNKSLNLFVIDADPFKTDYPEAEGFKQVFINAEFIEKSEMEWVFSEGCLSLPEINEEVHRPEKVKVKYLDENFVEHISEFEGLRARVVQHEMDHIQGIVFVDHIKGVKKIMLKSKLTNLVKGKVSTKYKMNFVKK